MRQVKTVFVALVLLLSCGADRARTALVMTDVGGKACRPLDPGDDRANVLLFVRKDCPISNGNAPEIERIAKKYGGQKINFYLVYTVRDLSVGCGSGVSEAVSVDLPGLDRSAKARIGEGSGRDGDD